MFKDGRITLYTHSVQTLIMHLEEAHTTYGRIRNQSVDYVKEKCTVKRELITQHVGQSNKQGGKPGQGGAGSKFTDLEEESKNVTKFKG